MQASFGQSMAASSTVWSPQTGTVRPAKAPRSFWACFPISVRIYAILTLGLLSLGIGIAVHFMSDAVVGRHETEVRMLAGLSEQARMVERDVLRLRLAASRFSDAPETASEEFAAARGYRGHRGDGPQPDGGCRR